VRVCSQRATAPLMCRCYRIDGNRLDELSEEATSSPSLPYPVNSNTTVRRAGLTFLTAAEGIVVGDIVELSAGDIVPADCLFIAGDGRILVNEFAGLWPTAASCRSHLPFCAFSGAPRGSVRLEPE
jgi:hypothetical protein